jgi:hypothetical protein
MFFQVLHLKTQLCFATVHLRENRKRREVRGDCQEEKVKPIVNAKFLVSVDMV